jgi:hypothetical protein
METAEKMKRRHSIRPAGRSPVISGRVPESLHERIQAAAKATGRTMSEEMAALIGEALDYRDRYVGVETRRAVEWLAQSFVMAGERTAEERKIDRERWTTDADCRRAAVMRLCETALTGFMSADPEEHLMCVAALKGRVALPLFNPSMMTKKGNR